MGNIILMVKMQFSKVCGFVHIWDMYTVPQKFNLNKEQ